MRASCEPELLQHSPVPAHMADRADIFGWLGQSHNCLCCPVLKYLKLGGWQGESALVLLFFALDFGRLTLELQFTSARTLPLISMC